MESLDLIRLQISLEYQPDEQGLLVPFNNSSEQAYYIVYQHSLGYIPYYHHELPTKLHGTLVSLGSQVAFTHPENIRQVMAESCLPCRGGENIFWSGYFSRPPITVVNNEACRIGEAWSIFRQDQEVCRAVSIRQNDLCAEVYVETLPGFRRRGYGRQVVTAWATEIMNSGRVPLYSYKMINRASAALANSLGVEWYANVIAYEPGE